MKVLLLSAYDAESHRRWRSSLVEGFPCWDWNILHLPPRFFNWRIRGNSLTWALSESSALSQRYDCVLATSMVDLATLRGLVPSLASIPAVVYCHENQFAYPVTANQRFSIEPQMVTLYSGLCADRLVFNSSFNRETFLSGVDRLLKKMPDAVPAGVTDVLRSKSQVLPVPIENEWFERERRAPVDKLHVVWNHRWEYDKGPEQLLACVQQLPPDTRICFHVVGQQFRNSPAVFADLKQLLVQRGWLGCWGYVDSVDAYRVVLGSSHVVLSTSWHDFQGLSVLDAVARGCVPLVPDRLAYRELFSECYRYYSAATCNGVDTKPSSDKLAKEAQASAEQLCVYSDALVSGKGLPLPADIHELSWTVLANRYQALLECAGD